MSLAGQVLWKRHTVCVCDVAIAGKPSPAPAATAPLAALRNLRREAAYLPDPTFAGASALRLMGPPRSKSSVREREVSRFERPPPRDACRGQSQFAAICKL